MSPESLIAKAKQYKMGLIIGGVILLGLFVGLPLLIESSKDTTPSRVAAFQSHLDKLSSLVSKQAPKLSSPDLENQTTNLIVILSGGSSTVSAYITDTYGSAEPDATIAAKDADSIAKIETSIAESRLSNTYEKTFRDLVTLELAGMYREATALSGKTGTKGKQMFSDIAGQIKVSHDGFVKLAQQDESSQDN